MTKKPQMLQKEQAVEELRKKMDDAVITILTDYRGLNVAEDTELRAKLREAGVSYAVAKNTLIKLAAHGLEIDDLDQFLEGPTAVAFSSDPVGVSKVLIEFAKTHKKLEIKSGLLEKKLVNAEEITNLAKLPSREVLLAQLLGAVQSPMYGFAGSLAGILRKFVYALDQVREQKANAQA
jgi:large subunit ribosomal protein L10